MPNPTEERAFLLQIHGLLEQASSNLRADFGVVHGALREAYNHLGRSG